MRNSKWFVVPSPRLQPALRLVCLPYAGGAAATYIPWSSQLPDEVELVCVQLPGRASRIAETPFQDMKSLVDDLAIAFREVADRPYVLFGHSMGSRIAYELARRYRNLRPPSLLIASGSDAPHFPKTRAAIHGLPDAEFVARLRELDGTPDEVLDNEELMAFLTPLLRADFRIAHHRCDAEMLRCPITVLWGTEDREVSKEAIHGWREVSGGRCDIHPIKGGHFFLERNRPAVLEKIRAALHTVMAQNGYRRAGTAHRDGAVTPGLPHFDSEHLPPPDMARLRTTGDRGHPPRVLLLYGSLRPESYSRKLALEAERILQHLGAETRVFEPRDLPMLDSVPAIHPEVQRLREWSGWSEGQVWISAELHGAMTGVFKNQIDWLPVEEGEFRPTEGRALAVMQVCGGAQSFNVVNALRVLGRWMRMVAIPTQSSVSRVRQEFDERGVMKPSATYDRVVDTMEELVKFTVMLRGRSDYLASRYSERRSTAIALALEGEMVEP